MEQWKLGLMKNIMADVLISCIEKHYFVKLAAKKL